MSTEKPAVAPAADQERERWSSRAAFYFAAVGSAVGFGNVWRFPSLVYEYGGGAFFVPYVLALLFIGLPILVLEVSLGQYYETGGERPCFPRCRCLLTICVAMRRV